VFELIRNPTGLTYVGRLDIMTTGLLLLTTDGDAVNRLTHPRYRIPRRYTALVHGVEPAELEQRLRQRVVVDGRPVVPQSVRLRAGRDGRSLADVPLTQGGDRSLRERTPEVGARGQPARRVHFGAR